MQANKMYEKQNLMFAIRALMIGLILWSNLTAMSYAGSIEHARENGDQVLAEADQGKPETENGEQISGWSLIDWNLYKQKFNKNYSSLSQQLLRQKIFMSKQIQVFLGWIEWRLQKKSYFLSINQFSDLTPEEEQQKMSGEGGDDLSDDDDDEIMDDEQARRALLEELEEEEGEVHGASNRREPLNRHKRSLISDLINRNFDLNALVRLPSVTDLSNTNHNIKWVVPSNNPDYQAVESHNFGLDAGADKKVPDIPQEAVEDIVKDSSNSLTLLKLIGDTARSSVDWFITSSLRSLSFRGHTPETGDLNSGNAVPNVGAQAPTDDKVIIDWRNSGCLAPPIDQDSCESCYAISSMSFIEWALCMKQDRTLTPLSVQYVVSCGPQFREESDPALNIQFAGCRSGRSRQTVRFVKEYGVELAAHMPYLARDTECPIAKNTPLKHKGYIRPNVKQQVRMLGTTNQLELALKIGPVIANFRSVVGLIPYGGGMLGRCEQRGGHAMLVVGHGVENGTPYLIIKNSFGLNWGIEGYFKFDRKYTEECVKDFVKPRVSFPSKKAQNRRVKAYLAGHQSGNTKANLASSTSDLGGIFDLGSGGLFPPN